MIAVLTICLVARGRPSVTSATVLEEDKRTIVASATISRTNKQPMATSTSRTNKQPIPGTTGQSTGTTPTATAGLGPECGNIDLEASGELRGPANARQIENCFWQAYQQCRPASLMLTIHIKTGVSTHTFSTTPKQGSCVVSDTVQSNIAGSPSQPEIYNCARLENTQTALRVVNCGEDTFDIPSS